MSHSSDEVHVVVTFNPLKLFLAMQTGVLKAAQDMSAILMAEKHKSAGVKHPNEMAALALTFNPVSCTVIDWT